MKVDRREFLILAAGTLAGYAVGAGTTSKAGAAAGKTVDVGKIEEFQADGVYTRFRYQGFFLIRRGGRFSALSSNCTHRRCTLKPAEDSSFICPCHGSTFDAEGKVTKGPAQIDLPKFPVLTTPEGRVLVQVIDSD